MHFQSKWSLKLECGGGRLECRTGQTLMKRQGEVYALITEGLPAISKEIWVSEIDKDMSRDAIAFACCLSLPSNPAALFLFFLLLYPSTRVGKMSHTSILCVL